STITITPSGGFTGAVTLSCSLTTTPANVVDKPTCSVTQPPAITGTGAVTATVSLSTTGDQSASLRKNGLGVGAGATFAALLCFLVPRRRRAWQALLGLLLLAVAVATATGCGTVAT